MTNTDQYIYNCKYIQTELMTPPASCITMGSPLVAKSPPRHWETCFFFFFSSPEQAMRWCFKKRGQFTSWSKFKGEEVKVAFKSGLPIQLDHLACCCYRTKRQKQTVWCLSDVTKHLCCGEQNTYALSHTQSLTLLFFYIPVIRDRNTYKITPIGRHSCFSGQSYIS